MDTLTEWGAITGNKIVVLDDLMMDAADNPVDSTSYVSWFPP